jgi:hypothetical protein
MAGPNQPTNILGTILSSVWHAFTSSPAGIIGLVLVVLMMLVSVCRAIVGADKPIPGERRSFSSVERVEILRRAGNRCERWGLLSGRCRETTKLHADHVHPYARGGATSMSNAAALCSRHNKIKNANVPTNFGLRQMEKHRAGYLPVLPARPPDFGARTAHRGSTARGKPRRLTPRAAMPRSGSDRTTSGQARRDDSGGLLEVGTVLRRAVVEQD